ncbi:tyrosine-protein phosphatase 10D-like protein [Leptotrombidium deliense]|uniref:protein-tyrosine-phosphatase n=1 Tax=Leptotrombidium deliense TaxID=299467 RepID=A0A443SN05_9ACAR|nr:tyrosine-protein phosphatase 10D-like protein [Leptotrombidium deliense]
MTLEVILNSIEENPSELKQSHVFLYNMAKAEWIRDFSHTFQNLNPSKGYEAKFNALYHSYLPKFPSREEKVISSDIMRDIKSTNENSKPQESPTDEAGWKVAVGVVAGAAALIIILAIFIIRNNKRKLKHNVTNKNSLRNGSYLDNNVATQRGAIGLIEYPKSGGVDNEAFQDESASKNSTLNGNNFVVTKYSLPIKVSEFNSVYNSMKENNEAKIREEFQKVKQITETKILVLASQRSAKMTSNRLKNRFANIVPYDHSRVKLSQISDDISSDYINANFVPGFSSKKEYIATQGPLRKTLNDFWRMICEYNISVIVNLTQSVEGEVIKCETYWPTLYQNGAEANLENGSSKPSLTTGSYNITLAAEKSVGDFTIRDLEVNTGRKTFTVKQFHLTHWPDFESPRNAPYLLNLIKIVRNHCDEKQLQSHTRNAPILVHCSAGVGRTGTFIAVDRLYQELVYRCAPQIDIFGTVMDMRQHRVHMVQSEDQYIFIYDCVASMIDELPKGSNTTRSKSSSKGSRSSNVTLPRDTFSAEGEV